MKLFLSIVRMMLVAVSVGTLISCESSDEPKRRKPVGPTSDLGGQPWNRPQQWEGAGRFGGMMPQSR